MAIINRQLLPLRPTIRVQIAPKTLKRLADEEQKTKTSQHELVVFQAVVSPMKKRPFDNL